MNDCQFKTNLSLFQYGNNQYDIYRKIIVIAINDKSTLDLFDGVDGSYAIPD